MLSATVTLTRLCRVSLIVSCVLWKGQTQSRGQIWSIGWSTHWWTFYMKFYLEILISDFRSDRELLIKVGGGNGEEWQFLWRIWLYWTTTFAIFYRQFSLLLKVWKTDGENWPIFYGKSSSYQPPLSQFFAIIYIVNCHPQSRDQNLQVSLLK